MTSVLWGLPSPFDAVAVGLWALVWCGWLAARRATSNLATLGPWWPLAYWLAVGLAVKVGSTGMRRLRLVRRGNDFWEFDPNRAGGAWAGRGVRVVRWQVALELWAASSAVLGGYGAAVALLVVGFMWDWLFIAAGVAALVFAARARWLGRVAWWEAP